MRPLCEAHRSEWLRWLDYRAASSVKFNNDAAWDVAPAGVVDRQRRRSDDWREIIRFQQTLIRDACARECSPTIGSLFSGAGALCELAVATLLGGRVAWHCENNPAAARLLTHRFPGTPNLGDITAVDWERVEPVNVLAYGFPCQDISTAGRRAGIEGARSGLWSHTVDAIRILRPRLVVVENVAALVVRGLDRVLADLAAVGFDAEWATIRASDVGAPHRRERLVLTAAHPAGPRWGSLRPVDFGDHGRQTYRLRPTELGRRDRTTADPDGLRSAWSGVERDRRTGFADRDPGQLLPTPRATDGTKGGPNQRGSRGDLMLPSAAAALLPVADWGKYASAIDRWAGILGRPAPAPTITGARGGRKLNPALTEWMMGWPSGWVTDVPDLTTNEQLRLCGNGVVPQQIQAALRHLLPLLESNRRAA